MFKKLREKISKSISRLSEGAKTGLSIFAAPVFPAIHAAVDFSDFKGFWARAIEENRNDPPQNGEVGMVGGALFFTAVWMAAATEAAHLVDNALVDGEHHEKINAVVSSIKCEPVQQEGRAFCGSAQVSATPGFLPWVEKDAANIIVVADKRVQQGFNEHAPALNVCQSKQYATFPIDQAFFVANDDDTKFVTVSEPDCRTMALEQ
ncbi:MAG: hypothetical protein H6861_06405 [Rhodospirillales bacterium]|nr:hypothetical protein [Rhodospirillales bacterium]